MITQDQVNKSISSIKTSEKNVKAKLGELSLQLLEYVVFPEHDSRDIGAVNRLITVLSPANKRVAIAYFKKHLPFSFNAEKEVFGKLLKNQLEDKGALVREALDTEYNIWAFTKAEVKISAPKDYKDEVKKVVARALKGNEKTGSVAISSTDVINAILEAGVSASDIIKLLASEEAA